MVYLKYRFSLVSLKLCCFLQVENLSGDFKEGILTE